jgi:restriction system protein
MSKFIEEPFNISPERFEEEVEKLLRRSGIGLPEFKVQRLEKIQASDGVYEIDVTARFEVLGSSFLVLVECKHHKNPIKREVVQVLYDRIRAVGAHKGMIFSTASFQKGAVEFARAHKIALIKVIDGTSFRQMMTFSCATTNTLKLVLGGDLDGELKM